ncbi:MAG: cytochrome c3 family protein [Pseudomonadota bacterium]
MHKKITANIQILILFYVVLSWLTLSLHGSEDPNISRNSAKECAICHYRWLDTFFIYSKGTDLVEFQAEKVVSSQEMCQSCHDGSVVDSRLKLSSLSGHKVDKAPPESMEIPNSFPLDSEGRVQCATCHTPHVIPGKNINKETIFLRVSNINSQMCKMCHKKESEPKMNHPTGKTNKKVANQHLQDELQRKNKSSFIYCESCHVTHGPSYSNLLIKDKMDNELCIRCHTELRQVKKEEKPGFSNLKNEKNMDEVVKNLKTKGAVFTENNQLLCISCHRNHKIKNKKLLLSDNSKSQMCITCHKNQKAIIGTKHDLSISMPSWMNINKNRVKEAGPCSACHLPHYHGESKLWAFAYNNENSHNQECLICHQNKQLKNIKKIGMNSHKLDIVLTKNINNKIKLPLFSQGMKKDSKGKIQCASCHNVHQWDEKDDMNKGYKTIDGDASNSFLRISNNQDSALCLECHADKKQVLSSDHNLMLTAAADKNILQKTVKDSGPCSACHVPHNAQSKLLWARFIPSNKNYLNMLCLECHNKIGIASKKAIHMSDVHMVDKPLKDTKLAKNINTIFKTVPLFDELGNKTKGGMMTCLTCHSSHIWDSKINGMIRDYRNNREGDINNSFLRQSTEFSSGLCTVCHPVSSIKD